MNIWNISLKMRAMAQSVKIALGFGVIALAAPAGAELGPSTPEAIAGAVSDCWAAVGPSVDETKLQQLGWKVGTWSSPDGKAEATPLRVYGKAGSNVLLMLTDDAQMPLCTVLSAVAKPDDINLAAGAIQNSLIALDPELKATRSGKGIVFIALPRLAMVNGGVGKGKPSVRVVVSYRNPEKK